MQSGFKKLECRGSSNIHDTSPGLGNMPSTSAATAQGAVLSDRRFWRLSSPSPGHCSCWQLSRATQRESLRSAALIMNALLGSANRIGPLQLAWTPRRTDQRYWYRCTGPVGGMIIVQLDTYVAPPGASAVLFGTPFCTAPYGIYLLCLGVLGFRAQAALTITIDVCSAVHCTPSSENAVPLLYQLASRRSAAGHGPPTEDIFTCVGLVSAACS